MLKLELNAILEHLQSQGTSVNWQKETDQLCIVLKIADREFPLFIRIFEGSELLQLLAFLPCNTNANTLPDTARLLHLLNKEIDLPGFGMDETSFVVFYRTMIPVKDKMIDSSILSAFLNAVQVVCQSFAPAITAVAHGALTFKEILRKSQAQGSQSFTETQLKAE